jgi:hypothetical protein
MKTDSLNTLTDVLGRLDKLNFDSVDGNELISSEGWSVSFRTIIATMVHDVDNFPVQISLQVRFKGKHVFSWGCISNEENSEFIKWYTPVKSRAIGDEMKKEDANQLEGKALFAKL